jgi:hypothetical protein
MWGLKMTNFIFREAKAKDVRDNEIITAEYWNLIFGIDSNFYGYAYNATGGINRRSQCNVYNFIFDEVIGSSKRIQLKYKLGDNTIYAPTLNSGIKFSSQLESSNENKLLSLFNNINSTNTEQVIYGLPFILIWNFVATINYPFVLPNPLQPFPTNYLLRTTVERDYLKTGSSTELKTETIASNFVNIKNNDVGIGTISFNTSSNVVTGVNTKFGDGDVGRKIYVNSTVNGVVSVVKIGNIASITNSTTAILEQNAKITLSATNYLFSEMGRANITTSMCYVAQSTNDSYYVTIAHSFSQQIRVVGNVRLIVNPGMV